MKNIQLLNNNSLDGFYKIINKYNDALLIAKKVYGE